MAGLPPQNSKLDSAEDESRPVEDSGIAQEEELSRSEDVPFESHFNESSNTQGATAIAPAVNSGAESTTQLNPAHTQAESTDHEGGTLPKTKVVSQATDCDDNYGQSSPRVFVSHTSISSTNPSSSSLQTHVEIGDLKAQLAEKVSEIEKLKKDCEMLSQEKDEAKLQHQNIQQQLNDFMYKAQTVENSKDKKIQELTARIAHLEQEVRKLTQTIRTDTAVDALRNLSIREDEETPNQDGPQAALEEVESPTCSAAEETVIMQATEDQAHVEAKYVEVLEHLMKSKKIIDIQYLMLFLVGPPLVGKTTTRNRLLKMYENLRSAKEETQSTLLANCNQALAFVNGDDWLSLKNTKEEARLLFGCLKELVPMDEETCSGKHPGADAQDTADTFAQAPIQETPQSHNKLETVIGRLKDLIKSGDYSKLKSMVDSAFLNIHDVGGQPGFLEMLPALIRGPAMYLVCFKMSDELEKPYMIGFSRHDTHESIRTTPYESLHSVATTISQILSSIANIQCVSSEPSPAGANEFSKMVKKLMKVHPAVAFIGTHQDVVVKDGTEEAKRKKINNTLDRVVRQFDESNIAIIRPEGCDFFFSVDNLEGTDSVDIAPLRRFISYQLKTQFKDASLSIKPSWLLFGIILRNEYRIVKMSDCLKIGKVLQMDENEVKLCLWYLHHCVGTLMYYPDLPNQWFKDHVICSPQVIFDSISQLILASLKALHSGGIYQVHKEKMEWLEKGLFSIQSIERYCAVAELKLKEGEIIPIKNLIELLKYVNLLSPLGSKSGQSAFFMPAVLECARLDELEEPPSPDANNPEPLFITFNCGYVPTGVFCGLVTHLVSLGHSKILGLEWKLKEKGVKRNCVSFFIHKVNVVTLLSRDRCYEIRVTRKQNRIVLHDLCAHVLSVVLYVLESLCGHITPIIAFQCPCPKHVSVSRHHKHLCILERDVWLQCLCENNEVVLRKNQRIWIGKDVALGSTASLEVLKFARTDLSFHWIKDGSRDPIPLSSKHNVLSFPKVREDDFGHYQCQVKKGEKVVFTAYRALFKDETYSKEEAQMPVTKVTLDSEIEPHNMISLAEFFDKVDDYLDVLGLNEGEQTDVKSKAQVDGTRSAMNKALKLWHTRVTHGATYNKLIDIAHSLGKEEIAEKINEYFVDIIMKQ